jgi:hypothetical protein
MNENHRKDGPSETKKLLKNASVVYTDGNIEIFEAIQVTDRGVVIGRFYKEDNGAEEFVSFGFIPQTSIKQIRGRTKIERALFYKNLYE